mgnify:CR=1 FL=1
MILYFINFKYEFSKFYTREQKATGTSTTINTGRLQLKKLGLPDEFVGQGKRDELLAILGLDTKGILQTVRNLSGQVEQISI